MKRRNTFYVLTILGVAMLAAGCGPQEEAPTVVVDSEESVISYSLVNASMDSVVLTQRLDCTYVQTNDQEVSFDVTGKFVDKVYVKNGDDVKKGDLLCELSSSALEEEIEKLTYNIEKNELKLSNLDMNEALDIQDRWVAVEGMGFFDPDSVNESVVAIKENYDRQRVLINDALEFDREELALKKKELANSRVYATMDGRVYKLKDHLEGSTTKAGTVIMTIVDRDNCLFMVKGIEGKEYFKDGEYVDMNVSYSTASGDYLLLPYDMDNWTENMMFSIYTGPDTGSPEVGTMGTISVVVEEKDNVLSIPRDVLHLAEDKAFVYTLSPDNNREIRYIEVGLIGDDRVEVLSGLTDGEKVVKK